MSICKTTISLAHKRIAALVELQLACIIEPQSTPTEAPPHPSRAHVAVA